MGNEQSLVGKNLDKRTARREHKSYFLPAVQRAREELLLSAETNDSVGLEGDSGRAMRVYIRKRPIFKHEIDQGEYDVITCVPGQDTHKVVIHDARMHSDMKRMYLDHYSFPFDYVFSEGAENERVYCEAAAPLVSRVFGDGVTATVMMYGQTGSGKTYTMASIQEQAVVDIFQQINVMGAEKYQVGLSYIELAGDKASDLLNDSQPIKLLADKDGSVQPHPKGEIQVSTSEELLALLCSANARRATSATGVHDQSSRSHAVVSITIQKQGSSQPGVLNLVDLAGSEQRIDSANHTSEQQREGAQINISLSALKACVRAKAANASLIPYRKSKLTHLLRSAFSDQNPTCIIATVSPAAKDTEHSVNTLKHACLMDGQGSSVDNGTPSRQNLGGVELGKEWKEKRAAKDAEAQANKSDAERDIDQKIAVLQEEMASGVSKAQQYALKKKIQMLKADAIKIQRKKRSELQDVSNVELEA
mmetsp:Transcript_3273/g.5269  ORF Transcript_3273/g.5269 Transcript_3273/m.5269 type:complete len:477 (+) Transcript_3273:24-1454(+)